MKILILMALSFTATAADIRPRSYPECEHFAELVELYDPQVGILDYVERHAPERMKELAEIHQYELKARYRYHITINGKVQYLPASREDALVECAKASGLVDA